MKSLPTTFPGWFPAGCLAFLLVLLTGCSKTTLTHQALDFNKTIQQHRLEQLFLNVIRASNREPMAMTAVNVLTTTNQRSASGNLAFPLGPLSRGPYAARVDARYSQTPRLDMLILDNDDEFVKGFMRPISSETINYFLHQGWNHELLAHLLIEAIDGRLSDFGIPEQEEISRHFRGNPPSHVRIDNDPANPLFNNLIQRHLPNLELHEDGFRIVNSNVRLRTRSPQGILYYLGELTRINLDPEEPGEIPIIAGKPLFLVRHGAGTRNTAEVSINFRNQLYVIPKNPKSRSLSALTLVQQLVNLQTKKVQPATSTIQLIGG